MKHQFRHGAWSTPSSDLLPLPRERVARGRRVRGNLLSYQKNVNRTDEENREVHEKLCDNWFCLEGWG